MRCRICNAYIPEGAGYCLECGAGPEPEQVCQKCGALVGAQARFCRKCGAALLPGAKGTNGRKPPAADSSSCSRCGDYVPAGIRYCPSCGTPRETGLGTGKLVEKGQVSGSELSSWSVKRAEAESCPACGTEPRGSGRFCYACGRFLRAEIEDCLCPSCGAVNALRYSRCQHCGSEMPAPVKTEA